MASDLAAQNRSKAACEIKPLERSLGSGRARRRRQGKKCGPSGRKGSPEEGKNRKNGECRAVPKRLQDTHLALQKKKDGVKKPLLIGTKAWGG